MERFIASVPPHASLPLRRSSAQAQASEMTPPACALLAWQRADGRRMLRDPLPGSATDRTRLSNRFLELLGGAEGDLLAGLDLDGFAGGRIAAHARGALADLQDAEPADADALALLEVLDDIADQAAKDGFSLLFRQFVILRKARRQVLQCHGSRCCLGCH